MPRGATHPLHNTYLVFKKFQVTVTEPLSYCLKTIGVDCMDNFIIPPGPGHHLQKTKSSGRYFASFIEQEAIPEKKGRKHKKPKKDTMETLKRHFKIVVLDDNEFYNNMLTRQLKRFTEDLASERGCSFEINSYTSAYDCLRNLKEETDIAILDYYLGDSMNALKMLEAIKEKCRHCKVIVISQIRNAKTCYQTLDQGAYHFILKDRQAFFNSCSVVENIVKESCGQT